VMTCLSDKLLSCIQIEDNGCWTWMRYRSKAGYGYLRVDGNGVLAHRLSYSVFREPIPEGMTIDHLCRNRGCINPDHLEAVTIGENGLRGTSFAAINARKTHCAHGHELSGDNLLREKSRPGRRVCRQCKSERHKRWYARKRAT
jgi:hypothetical protein